ncbi:MAG TPA: A24 family peptidase [Syntrophales bacterium]|mgnify:CR=1 FL=1|nr:A24 family peptidase [Syntrophales bacterium]
MEVAFFIFGAVVGSFLNVCIYRLPEERSLVSPSSRCRHCGRPIRFYDNIPILSYLILRGRCRDCKERISPRYPLVEALAALAALVLLRRYGSPLPALVAFVFVCALIVVTFIDLDHQIIPHAVTLPGIPLFTAAAVLVMGLSPLEALTGLFSGIAVLYLIALYYESITGNEGMGGGDVNLLGMMGGFLGWKALLVILPVAALTGAAVGVVLMLVKGKDLKYAVPFGPFLSLGAAVHILLGHRLLPLLFGGP